MSYKFFFPLLSVLLLFKNAKADQWRDPSWREMIDSSDVIALIKYTSNGMYRAQAQVVTVYKGNLKAGNSIWISGYSNRYGPFDSVSRGEMFVVFLNQSLLSESRKQYWEEQVKENPSLLPYYTALKNKVAYSVWTPTAGDLRVRAGKVQYDLLQTTYYTKQHYYPLPAFENFLRFAIAGNATTAYYQRQLNIIKLGTVGDQLPQSIMALYLTRYDRYNAFYETLSRHKRPEVRFALAELLGNVKTEQSRNLLIQLLDDENSFVQGEAVRQLANEPKEVVGPIFVAKLSTAGKGVAGRSDIMNPVVNTMNGGQIEIIKTLEKLHYKEAITVLLPLLETKDQYTFELVLEALQSLGFKGYSRYLIKHLETGTRDLLFTISTTIVHDSLTECLPALMKYVTTHDRTKHPTPDYLVSTCCGLGHFTTDTVKHFMVADFLSILDKDLKQSSIDNKRKWVEQYTETFTKLGIDSLKPYLYNFLGDYYGLNFRFRNEPALFSLKKQREDSLVNLVKATLPRDSIEDVKAVVFLSGDGQPIISNYVVRYTAKTGVSIDHMNGLLKQAGIDEKHLMASVGNFRYLYGGRELLHFDDGILDKFLQYLAAFPDKKDIAFMESLSINDYPETNYDRKKLKEYTETAKKNLR